MLLLEFYGMGGCVNIYHEFCMHHGNELERRFEAYFFGEFGHMLNFWMDCKNLKSWHMQIWVSAFQNVWALFRFASNMCPICIFKDLLSVLGNGKHIFRFFFLYKLHNFEFGSSFWLFEEYQRHFFSHDFF